MQTLEQRVAFSLLSLRLTVFLVMLMWTLDKFVNPDHAALVFANFYGLEGMGAGLFAALGIVELLILIAFVAGAFRRFSYGAVLIFHAVSTLSSYAQYLEPWKHLLFFAAWPMLAACLTLYLLREQDSLFTFDSFRARSRKESGI